MLRSAQIAQQETDRIPSKPSMAIPALKCEPTSQKHHPEIVAVGATYRESARQLAGIQTPDRINPPIETILWKFMH
jgi:hypothetical protein